MSTMGRSASGRLASGAACWRGARMLGKPLLMPMIAARAIGAGPRPGSRSLVAAQGFSWLGDVALMGRGRGPFLVGVGSFLAAQVAYVSAYRSRSSTTLLATPTQRRIMAVGTVGALAMGAAARRQDRVLAIPVTAYGVTLACMVTAAAGVDADQGRSRLLAGAWLFLVSDTLIGVRRFMLCDRTRRFETAVMASYLAAQWCISDAMRKHPPATEDSPTR